MPWVTGGREGAMGLLDIHSKLCFYCILGCFGIFFHTLRIIFVI